MNGEPDPWQRPVGPDQLGPDPAAPPAADHAPQPTVGGPCGNRGLGVALLVLSGVTVLGDLLSAATAPAAVRAYEAAAARGEDPAAVLTAYDAAAVLGVALLGSWIVGSLWLGVAHSNAMKISPYSVDRSRLWTWIGWIVPIVCLWYPKQIIDNLWDVTAAPGTPDRRTRRRLTGFWWAAWIAYLLLGRAVSQNVFSSAWGGGDDVHQGVIPGLDLAVAVVSVAAFALFAAVVRGVSRSQETLAVQPARR